MASKYQENNICRKTTLDNGLRIVTEQVRHLQSVSIGIWVRSGSRFEHPSLNGICHFIEHMLFKGTERRTAYAIAKEIDSVGGVLNAFTSKEMTSYYCKVLDENVELATDLLADIFLNASFPEEEIEREKMVVCQEIHQMEDNPEDLIHEELGIRFWRDDPLGQPILGTVPTVVKFDRNTIMDFKRRTYSPEETVVCAAGSIEHDRLVDLIAKQMDRLPRGSVRAQPPRARNSTSSHVVVRDIEQAHICIAMEGPSVADDNRHAGYILNAILGGGMSSRLFQEIREKRGLAYSVYSFMSSFSDTGVFGIYAGCDPAGLDEVVALIKQETHDLPKTVTEDEMLTAKNQIKGNMILAMESSDSVMSRLAKGEYYFGRYVPLNEVISRLDSVTLEDLKQIGARMMDPGTFTCVALGPISEHKDVFGHFSH